MHVLIAEDERQIAESLSKNFMDEGHRSNIANDGDEALKLINSTDFDLVLLDWKMPKLTGLDVCKIIRSKNSLVSIIFITALEDISNKLEAFNAGADDYIVKPFLFQELYARVNAILRRASMEPEILEFNEIKLDLNKRNIFSNSNYEIHLSDKEFDLFKYMILNKGVILNKENLFRNVWGFGFVPKTNCCEAIIKNLRKKIEELTGKNYIKNIYGEGYILIGD